MAVLPDSTNFYATVETSLSAARVAHMFQSDAWALRKCSLTDFEIFNDVAELVIESTSPVLIHGPVAEVLSNCFRIVEPLTEAGLSGSFECYDEHRVLMCQRTFGAGRSGG
jgi:hypothetical protein